MIPLSSYLQRDDKNYIINKDITARKILDQHEENENRIRDKKQFQDKSDLLQCIDNLKIQLTKNNMIKSLNFSFYCYVKNKVKSLFGMNVDFEGQTILSADKIYEKEADIILFLKRIQDIDKLKCILLNKEQRILFDWIKPTLDINSDPRNDLSKGKSLDLSEIMMKSLDIKQNPNTKIEEMLNALRIYEEKLKCEEEINDIDKNLLEFFKDQ